mgnify:CR=1 FL=1
MSIVNYTYWVWDGALTKDFCNSVLAMADWAAAETATVNNYGNSVVDLNKIGRAHV